MFHINFPGCTPWKINGWNPKSWRFGSDVFPFPKWGDFQVNHVGFRGSRKFPNFFASFFYISAIYCRFICIYSTKCRFTVYVYMTYTYNHYNYPDYIVRHLNLQDLEDLMIFPRSQSLSSQPETFSRVPFRGFAEDGGKISKISGGQHHWLCHQPNQ